MPIRFSSAMAQMVATSYGVAYLLDYGHIEVYSGDQPASADDEPTGDLLGYVTYMGKPYSYGDNIDFGVGLMVGGNWGEIIDTQDWRLTTIQDGTPGWWRFISPKYRSTGPGTTNIRMDGKMHESLFLDGDRMPPMSGPSKKVNFVLRFPT